MTVERFPSRDNGLIGQSVWDYRATDSMENHQLRVGPEENISG
jgi:hypothetical protein